MNQRSQIEIIKRDFERSLEKNSPKYRAAIIRELDFLYRKFGNVDEETFLAALKEKFDIPSGVRNEIINDLRTAQKEIAQLWKIYFHEQTKIGSETLQPNDFEKLRALYTVDFAKIKKETRDIIVSETIKIARSEQGYTALRARLKKRGLNEAESRTLANTSLAQFDNAMMFQFAAQGGITKFKYDGVLNENSRKFCKTHLGKIFTLEEINALDNKQGLPVKTSCGGYNCTHFFTPVIDSINN